MAITADHVHAAFAHIRDHGYEPNKDSTKWDIIDPTTQERFPPKAVLRIAYEQASEKQPSGGGGWATNDPLIALGFQIALKQTLEGAGDLGEAADIESIFKIERNETTRRQLVNARLGQGGFRQALLEIWKGRCAVTGCAIHEALRASHIKAWQHSSNLERLDPRNGLLLAASLDALFDNYLISFSDAGHMMVNGSLKNTELNQLGLPRGKQIILHNATKQYLDLHRQEFNKMCNNFSFIW